jgi:hypothetical protein
MTLESPAPSEVDPAGSLTAGQGETAISLPLTELFEAVDKIVGTSA